MHSPKIWLKILISLSLLGLALLLASSQTLAQNFVSGRVLDATGRPVAQATVLVRGNNVFTFVDTDSNGNWQFTSLPGGTYQFYAAASNYGAWPEPRYINTLSTNSILLTLGATPNAIAGGDFESQYTSLYWQEPNGGLIYTTDTFDGYTAARLGEGSATQVGCWQNGASGNLWTLRQPVLIPNSGAPALSFVYKISTSQINFDYAWLEVVLIADGQPYYLTPWGQLWQARDWTLAAFDLSQWRGQTVELLFQVARCSSHSLSATIDRVVIGDIPGAPAPGTTGPSPGPQPSPSNFTTSSRQLSACENMGMHHLFVRLRDANGVAMPGVNVRFRWDGGESIVTTGGKAEDLGLAEFAMYRGNYWISLPDLGGQEIGPFSPDIAQNEVCDDNGQIGNSLYHYSFEIFFQQSDTPIIAPTPTPLPTSLPPNSAYLYSVSSITPQVNEAITQIRGSVLDRFGSPVNGVRVRVRIGDFCTVSVPSGTPGVYPDGEYDVLLRNFASTGDWNVAIVDRPSDPQNNACDDTAQLLSPEVLVTTNTREGVVFVNFRQN